MLYIYLKELSSGAKTVSVGGADGGGGGGGGGYRPQSLWLCWYLFGLLVAEF